MRPLLAANFARPAPQSFSHLQWVTITFGGGAGTRGQVIGRQITSYPSQGIYVVQYHLTNHLGWVSDWQLKAVPTFYTRLKRFFQ